MPNFNLVVDSRFNPFTYQELLHPVMMATQAHQQLEDQYNALNTEAATVGEMANEQTDPQAYKRYKQYAEDLERSADELAKRGLSPSSRQGMLNLKTRYAQDINPIKVAYERRRALADEQRKAIAANPTMLYQRMANTISLDDLIENPELDYGQSYSGALITQQVANAASNIAKEARDSEEGRRKLRKILPYQYEMVSQNGFSREAVMKAILGSQDADKILTGLVDSAMETSGVRNWGDQATQNRALDYAKQGLYNAIGQTNYQMVTDSYGMQSALAKEAEARARAAAQQQQLNKLAINPMNLFNAKEQETASNNLKNYSKYFYRDKEGKWRMTDAGRKEYYRTDSGTDGDIQMTPEGVAILTNVRPTQTKSAFRQFMDKLGAEKYMDGKGGWQPGNMGNLWAAYSRDTRSAKYDATKATEFDYSIAGSQQGDMKDAIMTAARGTGKLTEVDYDGQSKQFKGTGQELSLEDLKSDRYKVTATRFSPYGSTVMIQDDKGKVRRYNLPAGINTINEVNRDKAMKAAQQYQQMIYSGTYTDKAGRTHTATQEELAYAQQQYAQLLQEAYLYHSQLGVQNKMKEQEFNPYGY